MNGWTECVFCGAPLTDCPTRPSRQPYCGPACEYADSDDQTPEVDPTVAHVGELPDCDVCQRDGVTAPAAYDAALNVPNRPWAFMCVDCFTSHGIGELGLGKGQRLEVAA